MADLNYKYGYNTYRNRKLFLAGYPDDPMYQNERHISSGEIKSIKGFEFEHSIEQDQDLLELQFALSKI